MSVACSVAKCDLLKGHIKNDYEICNVEIFILCLFNIKKIITKNLNLTSCNLVDCPGLYEIVFLFLFFLSRKIKVQSRFPTPTTVLPGSL